MTIQIRRPAMPVPPLFLLALALAVGLAFWAMRVATIDGSQIGVYVHNLTGGIDVSVRPGSEFYCGIWTDFYALDNTVQSLRMVDGGDRHDALDVKTKDGSSVRLDVALNYRLVQDPVAIARTVVPECGLVPLRVEGGRSLDGYKLKWIRDYARAVIRYKFGELKTDEFYSASARDQKTSESDAELNRLLRPHGLEVMNLVTERFRFYDEYERKIADKKAADQEVQSQEQIALAALESQKKRMAEATATQNVELARLEGELKKALLSVEAEAKRCSLEAEAYAFTTTTAAEAQLVQIENEAKAIVARARAEAEGMQAMVKALEGEGGRNLVRLEYARVLKSASFTGVPYATDPRVQKVELDTGPRPPAPDDRPASEGEAKPARAGGKEGRQ